MAQIDHGHVEILHYEDEPCPFCTALWMLDRYELLLEGMELSPEQELLRQEIAEAWKPPRKFIQTVREVGPGVPLAYERWPVAP
jgi:hypothetical protein